MTLTQIIWSVTIGLAIAVIYTFYYKKILGEPVRKLIEAEAFDELTAVTFESIGYKSNALVRYAIKKSSSFSGTVKTTDDGRYFIPEDMIAKATNKFRSENMTFLILLAIVLGLAAIALICIYAFPEIYEMGEKLFGLNAEV